MSFRNLLDEEFEFRANENPAYSLRAFARDIGVSPSQLSEVLNGKRAISGKKAMEIGPKLGLSQEETLLFKSMVEAESGRSPKIVNAAKKRLSESAFSNNFQSLSLDGFKLISNWTHFAILSTMELDDFDGSVSYLAQSLDVPQQEIDNCVKRLLKMELIDLKEGKFVLTGGMFTTTHDIQSAALKKFHKQHLQKSLAAIDEVEVELRDVTTMTMAIDLEKLPEAKKMIKDFRRKMCKFLESGAKNKVYNLNIQLIPLTKMDSI